MLKAFFAWLRGRHRQTDGDLHDGTDQQDFEQLNREAPLRQKTDPSAHGEDDTERASYLCREAVLGLDQRIAGYQFMLHEGTRNRIRHSSRRVHHLYAEVLVRTLGSMDPGRLLGHRFAFIEVPDSFLAHPSLSSLPASSIVVMPMPHRDRDPPALDFVRNAASKLRGAGFRLALPDPSVISEYVPLLDLADLIALRAPTMNAQRGLRLNRQLLKSAPDTQLLMRDLPALEDLHFARKMGASLFQGPFITDREDWSAGQLNPNVARLAAIITRLRTDGDTQEISSLLKQDGALALRLLRYINSAAHYREESIASIEHALVMLGRDRLYRWLVLLAFTTENTSGRSAAALETAMIRGRMMELLAAEHSPPERESLFLTGLLSLADIIMQVPLDKALTPFDLAGDVNAALYHRQGPLAPMLELAIASEGGKDAAEKIAVAAERCGVTPEQASNAHVQALMWALEVQQ